MNPYTQDDLFGGETGNLLRTTDWTKTPLGPLDEWPKSLISYATMILAMPSPAIIFWGDEQTQIYNDHYAAIMGPRHPRGFGAPFAATWPEAVPLFDPWMRQVRGHGEVIRREREHVTLTRYGFTEETYFTFTLSALRDDDGGIVGVFEPVFEVTDQVLSERRDKTLRALAPRGEADPLHPVLEAFSANPSDIPFVLLFTFAGAGPGLRLAGHTLNLVGHDRCFPAWNELAREALERNASMRINNVETLFDVQPPGFWPEPVRSALLVPIRSSAGDAPRGVIAFGISPRLHFDDKYRGFLELAAGQVAAGMTRVQALQQIERQRQYLSDLFMQAPASIAVLRGPEHVFELVNPLGRQFVGERDVIGKPIRVALPELDGRDFLTILDNVHASGKAFVGREVPTRLDHRGDGTVEEVFFNFVCQPIRDPDGAHEGILVFAFEVTHQVLARRESEALAEELKREHQRKDEFLATLAHELRNPLAAVTNAVRLLEPIVPETDGKRYAAILKRQAAVLSELVDELLDVSRITRGLVDLKHQPVDLVTVSRHALESVQPLMDAKQHDVSVCFPQAPVQVYGDPVRLEQIMANLLTNAAKYTDHGGRIAIALSANDAAATLRITDNGIGMDASVLGRVFDLFGQAEHALDRTQGGLGIGLTIAKTLVELHGGTISADSDGHGKGATFAVTLPLLQPAAERPAAYPLHVQSDTAGKRLLVVDDNPDTVETLALLLEDFGHAVDIAYDGPGALKKVQDAIFDVILLDIGLPGMDGYELARRLRDEPHSRTSTLVALTGYGQAQDRERTRKASFNAHFVKPVDIDTLAHFIAHTRRQQSPPS